MQSLSVDPKAKKIIFQDQNRNIVYLFRFIFGLDIMNAIIFFVLFNHQDDWIKWLWFVFALVNVVLLYLALTKFSVATELNFDEIECLNAKTILGVMFKLKNGKFRKIYLPRNSEQTEKLKKMIGKMCA